MVLIIVGMLLCCCVTCALILGISRWSSSQEESSADSDFDFDGEFGFDEDDFDWDEYWDEFDEYYGDGEEDEDDDEEDEQDVDDDASLSDFLGVYVSAELPEGWTITEYFDGDGSNMLVEGPEYAGLTGLKIFTPDALEAFSLQAVQGIGGVEACGQYYQFPDDNPAYLAEIQTLSAEVGVTPSIISIGAGEYSEFELFGISVRRAGYYLYKDRTEGNAFFEAACGINEFMEIDELGYTFDGMESTTYQEDVSVTLSEDELITLDQILSSLEGF